MGAKELAATMEARFSDPRDAIRWADNYLLRPECESLLGKMIKDNIHQCKTGLYSGDSESIAIYISTTLANCTQPYNHMVRLAYGRGVGRIVDIADQVTYRTRSKDARAKDLAILVVKQVADWERKAKKLTASSIAKELGYSRTHFYHRFGATYAEMRKEARRMLEKGINEVGQKLVDSGVVGCRD